MQHYFTEQTDGSIYVPVEVARYNSVDKLQVTFLATLNKLKISYENSKNKNVIKLQSIRASRKLTYNIHHIGLPCNIISSYSPDNI